MKPKYIISIRLGIAAKRYREDAKLTVSKFCKKSGIDPDTYKRFESGGYDLSINELHCIAFTLNIPLWKLIKMAETIPTPKKMISKIEKFLCEEGVNLD